MGDTCSTCCTTADEKKNELKEDDIITGQAKRIMPSNQLDYQQLNKQQNLRMSGTRMSES